MARRLITATAVAAAMGVALLGCTGGPAAPAGRASHPATRGTPTARASHPARPVTMAGARNCPVTTGRQVPGTKPWRELLFGWQSAYGNDLLWVGGLWPHGVVIITPQDLHPDGRLEMKFGWYRLTSGYLTITGRRLDGPARALSARTSGYALTGFNASAVIFPAEGCWQVTGRAGRASLTFVTFVIKGRS